MFTCFYSFWPSKNAGMPSGENTLKHINTCISNGNSNANECFAWNAGNGIPHSRFMDGFSAAVLRRTHEGRDPGRTSYTGLLKKRPAVTKGVRIMILYGASWRLGVPKTSTHLCTILFKQQHTTPTGDSWELSSSLASGSLEILHLISDIRRNRRDPMGRFCTKTGRFGTRDELGLL